MHWAFAKCVDGNPRGGGQVLVRSLAYGNVSHDEEAPRIAQCLDRIGRGEMSQMWSRNISTPYMQEYDTVAVALRLLWGVVTELLMVNLFNERGLMSYEGVNC